jgi:hypothetical protein
MGNPDPGLGQAQKYGSIKQVNGIPLNLNKNKCQSIN